MGESERLDLLHEGKGPQNQLELESPVIFSIPYVNMDENFLNHQVGLPRQATESDH
jgi:hypothetical protein